jgi:phosphoribosylanthranilate isomerase
MANDDERIVPRSQAAATKRLWVKICGITNLEDSAAAMDAGADALGFNLFPGSRRYLELASAGSWLRGLPAQVSKVAVLVNPTQEEALRIADLPFIDSLQLHGDEPADFCRVLFQRGVSFSKAFPAMERDRIRAADQFHTRTLILDAVAGGLFGGTGKVFPWQVAREWTDKLPGFHVILAGGLTPENVALAIREVQPFGIDVTTGVERSAGRKDHGRMRAFIAAARAALAR